MNVSFVSVVVIIFTEIICDIHWGPGITIYRQLRLETSAANTGGSRLSRTSVKLDSRLARIFCQKCIIKFLYNLKLNLVLIRRTDYHAPKNLA